jgi:hypothetical protein
MMNARLCLENRVEKIEEYFFFKGKINYMSDRRKGKEDALRLSSV